MGRPGLPNHFLDMDKPLSTVEQWCAGTWLHTGAKLAATRIGGRYVLVEASTTALVVGQPSHLQPRPPVWSGADLSWEKRKESCKRFSLYSSSILLP